MGKQISFFMDGRDEHEFAEFVVREQKGIFVPEIHDITPFPEFRVPEEADFLKHAISLLIWNKTIKNTLAVKQHAAGIFAVDKTNEPVVEFSRSFLRGRILVAGRLWAEMYSLDHEQKCLVHKGNDFEEWYNLLARWIRRHCTRERTYGMYIGRSAQRALEGGDLQLAQHITASGPI